LEKVTEGAIIIIAIVSQIVWAKPG